MKIRIKTIQSTIPLFHHSSSPVHCLYTPVFILLVYNSGDQIVLINDWYACLQVLSKQLTVWNAYLSLLGYNLVIAPVFPLICPRIGIEILIITQALVLCLISTHSPSGAAHPQASCVYVRQSTLACVITCTYTAIGILGV